MRGPGMANLRGSRSSLADAPLVQRPAGVDFPTRRLRRAEATEVPTDLGSPLQLCLSSRTILNNESELIQHDLQRRVLVCAFCLTLPDVL